MSLADAFRSALTVLSPSLNAKVCHRVKTGKSLDLKHPRTFSEKLVALKINNYNSSPLVKRCADKYAVRGYLEENGFGELLNDLIATYDSVDAINWDALPNQFAMKWNFGCGFNIVCRDKSALDVDAARAKMLKWSKSRWHLKYAELQYKNVPKKILVEKFLNTADGHLPPDYKLYCFRGKCAAILYISERDAKEHKGGFFDLDWNYLGPPQKESGKESYAPFDVAPPAPRSLDVMLASAERLSAPFPFVRMDYYDVDGRAVFGEMTFTPAGGHDASQIAVNGVNMADMLQL